MGRPLKKPQDRKTYKLRVPLDAAQRAVIDRAAMLAHVDKAEWARTVLLDAAANLIAKDAKKADRGNEA